MGEFLQSGVRESSDCAVHIARYARGIPEYPVGHHDTVRRLMTQLEGTGLHLAGNAWDGIGVNDCVAAALPRARAILESL